jgi:hypothetical protein
MTISGKPSRTDWERVKKDIAEDAPISYDPNDSDDGPYDPNDDAAVDAFFDKATIWAGWPNQVMIQKDGVPVKQNKTVVPKISRKHAKASQPG